MGKLQNPDFEAVLHQMRPMLEVAYNEGVTAGFEHGQKKGFEAGRALGVIEGINMLTPAVSDGLRHGSPVCGAAMQALKRLGLHDPDDKKDA